MLDDCSISSLNERNCMKWFNQAFEYNCYWWVSPGPSMLLYMLYKSSFITYIIGNEYYKNLNLTESEKSTIFISNWNCCDMLYDISRNMTYIFYLYWDIGQTQEHLVWSKTKKSIPDRYLERSACRSVSFIYKLKVKY